ncbi:MAG: 50S ribosomal protein L6 [Candidatus Omnitrophota bacterium]|nr:50S ribosomal protein L6 [Candidatus Omnitrophota bacterium]
MSRIGKNPILIPENVKVNIAESQVIIEGPKGNLIQAIPTYIKVEVKENSIIVTRLNETKQTKSNHGTIRALLFNMVKGVVEGYQKELEIQGVGFRAQTKDKILNMQLGFTHPVNFPIPEDIKISTPKPTNIIVQGIDKFKVGEVAANIRRVFPPEPYKGKGIRYVGEYVRRKQGKSVTK